MTGSHPSDDAKRADEMSESILARSSERALRLGATFLAATGVFLVLNGVLFLYRTYFTSGFEAGVHTLGGVTKGDLTATYPEVYSYIEHLHVNLTGAFFAMGVAMVALAWFGVRRGHRWAFWTTVAMPVVFLPLSLGVHQTVLFDFHTLIHLGPAGIGVPLWLVGVVLAYRGLPARTAAEAAGR